MAQPDTAPDAPIALPTEALEVGEPDVSGPLAVFPLIGPDPGLDYASFNRAHEHVAVHELEGGASVNDLTIHNQGPKPVLLYEGEELLGAQQNRVLDVSVLIASRAKITVPVSCVEAGRWDGSRHAERFRPSPQAADPQMRRMKHRRARERAAMGAEARADQGEVWSAVADRGLQFLADSPTEAMSDIFEERRDHLAELREPIGLRDGQCGAVVAINGRIAILDHVSRPDAWADLHPALLEGYALDALGAAEAGESADPPALSTVRGFVLLAGDAPAETRTAGPGLGETIRFAANGVAGSALIAEREMVQLTAFLD